MKARKLFAGILVLALGIFAVFYLSRSPRTQPETQVSASGRGETSQVPASSPSASPLPSLSFSDHDRHLVTELNEILASKNDNDRRLDTDFRNLTTGTKTLLMQRYKEMPLENRNDRGTVVFLIGRELNRPEDFQFLAQVAMETPCLSLADCKQEMHQTPEEMHEQSTASVTLAYPQLVAMKSLENLLNQQQSDHTQVGQALSTLDAMSNSPLPFIAQKAADMKTKYSQLPH